MVDLNRRIYGKSSRLPLSPTLVANLSANRTEQVRMADTIFTVPAYYVSTTGNDSRTTVQASDPSTPWLTVGHGLSQLSAGSTLIVRGGNYAESLLDNVPSGTSDAARVRIAAYPGEFPWLKPSSGDWVIHFDGNQAYIDFDGINIDGTAIGDASVFFDERIGGNPNHIRLMNAEVHHREGNGQTNAAIACGGSDNSFVNLNVHGTGGPYGFYLSGDRNIVDRCDIHAVSFQAVQIYHGGGTPTGNVVKNCRIHDITTSYFFNNPDPRLYGILVSGSASLIYNNLIYGLNYTYQSENAGIFVYAGSGHKIWNNTIYGNTTDGIVLGSYGAPSSVTVQNNLVWANTGNVFSDGGSGTTIDHNSWQLIAGQDPLFMNASLNDYHLQSTSPARNIGTTLSAVLTDLDGISRPQGIDYDLGCYERA